MAEKANTIKDLEQAMVDLGLRLCEDFNNGSRVMNESQSRLVDSIIKVYSAVKVREPPEKVNTAKSK